MTCRRSQVRVLYRPPKQEPLTLVRGFFVASSTNPRQSRTVQDSNRAAAHSAVSKATVRLCLARGSQRIGMSTGMTAVLWWRYRTRTAAEATAACGGNREPRLGPRSDFSKPCQGAAEKSANATRTGASRQIPSRFPTRRNVYQERCRPTHSSRVFLFWWTVQDENRDKQRQGITMRAISCLLIFLTRRGILGSVQQIGICEGALWTNI